MTAPRSGLSSSPKRRLPSSFRSAEPRIDPDDLIDEWDDGDDTGARLAERLARLVPIERRDRLSEAQYDCLLRLGNDDEGAGEQNQQKDRGNDERDGIADQLGPALHHWAPVWAAGGVRWGCWLSGR
jgi:hypothetical protein